MKSRNSTLGSFPAADQNFFFFGQGRGVARNRRWGRRIEAERKEIELVYTITRRTGSGIYRYTLFVPLIFLYLVLVVYPFFPFIFGSFHLYISFDIFPSLSSRACDRFF